MLLLRSACCGAPAPTTRPLPAPSTCGIHEVHHDPAHHKFHQKGLPQVQVTRQTVGLTYLPPAALPCEISLAALSTWVRSEAVAASSGMTSMAAFSHSIPWLCVACEQSLSSVQRPWQDTHRQKPSRRIPPGLMGGLDRVPAPFAKNQTHLQQGDKRISDVCASGRGQTSNRTCHQQPHQHRSPGDDCSCDLHTSRYQLRLSLCRSGVEQFIAKWCSVHH